MTLKVLKRAEKQIRKLPKTVQIGIGQQLRDLISNKILTEKKLQGYENIYRFRVGTYRVVYERRGGDIFVLLAGHRKDIYQSLSRLFG